MKFKNKYVVELKNVWVTYAGSDRPAIKNICLSIPSGKFVLIKGPNGAGKTTLIETCLGLLKPAKGNAYLLNVNTRSREIVKVRRLCGYVPQNFMKPPYEHYTVRQVIEMSLAWSRTIFDPLPKYFQEELLYYAKELDLIDLLDKPIGSLSGGQQQKVFLIRALIKHPKVLFLDEPFSSLDINSKTKVMDILREYLNNNNDTSIILVAHAIEEFDKEFDMIVYMNRGVIENIIVK